MPQKKQTVVEKPDICTTHYIQLSQKEIKITLHYYHKAWDLPDVRKALWPYTLLL